MNVPQEKIIAHRISKYLMDYGRDPANYLFATEKNYKLLEETCEKLGYSRELKDLNLFALLGYVNEFLDYYFRTGD